MVKRKPIESHEKTPQNKKLEENGSQSTRKKSHDEVIIKIEKESWRSKITLLVLGVVIGLIGNTIFSVYVVPYFTDKPEIDLLVVEPKLFYQGGTIELNVTLENTGKSTASDLLIYVIEQTGTKDYQSEITKNNPSIIKAGDTFNAIFPLKTPQNNESQWELHLWITTTDGHSWKFDIVYEFLIGSHQYHLLSWN